MRTLYIAFFLALSSLAHADQTTGGVNWLDTLGYAKPKFVSITVPSCGGATPNYFVDLASGSGTTCSSGSPCALASLTGKSGMLGGPACVFLRGVGGCPQDVNNIHGSVGSEIYFQAWPGQTKPVFQCNAPNNLGFNAPISNLIFDGGPNLDITFKTVNDNGTNGVAMRVNANNITIYRVQGTCGNNQGQEIFMTTVAGVANFKVINSEFYDCNAGTGGIQQSAVYMAGDVCNGVASYSDFIFQNNIVRNMGGEGMELNPRAASPRATISGNAFHNIGYNTCTDTAWRCRPAITVDSCGGTPSAVKIQNNLMWDIAASCAWTKSGDTLFANNTCYDYGKQQNHDGTGGNVASVEGVAVGNSGNAGNVTVRNNTIYSPLGKDPLDNAGFIADHNLCGSGKSCGTSSKVWTP